MYYTRITKRVNDAGTLIPANENIYKFIKNYNIDHYQGMYYYDEQAYNQWKKTKSIKGIKEVWTNKLWWDFDKEGDARPAQENAIRLVNKLLKDGIDSEAIAIAFSGKKGFDVTVHLNEQLKPKEVRAICKNYVRDFPPLDQEEPADPRMYNASRIFRITGTRHKDTKLFKTPLTINELQTLCLDEIKDMAKESYIQDDIKPCLLPEAIRNYMNVEKKEKKTESATIEHKLDVSKKPKHLSPCQYALTQGYYEDGEGDDARHRLAVLYKNQGMTVEQIVPLLEYADEQRYKRTGREPETLERLTQKAEYAVNDWNGKAYTCHDELMSKICNRCVTKCEKYKKSSIMSIGDVKERFFDYARNFDKNRILTGLKELDDTVALTTGMTAGFLASPGAGKTSFALNTLRKFAENEPAFIDSMDMQDNLLYARLLQKHVGNNFLEIVQAVQNDQITPEIRKAIEAVDVEYNKVGMNFQPGVTVSSMEERYLEYCDMVGESVRFWVVDYLEKIISDKSQDPTISSGLNANELSNLATKHDVCIFMLLQPQKAAGDPSKPLTSMRQVKGSSLIEQQCRVVFGMWRPGFNPSENNVNDNFASISILKSNMGGIGTYDFHWDGQSGTLRSLKPSERAELEQLREELESDEEKKGW